MAEQKFSLVEGLAPEPKGKGSGHIWGVYQALQTLAGAATERQIAQYLPAEVASQVNTKQLRSALSNGVTRGYLVKLDKNHWRIAPKSVYDARQARIRPMEAARHRKAKAATEKPAPRPVQHFSMPSTVTPAEPSRDWVPATCIAVTAVVGVAVGMVLGAGLG